MLANASRWDNFLALVAAFQAPWPQGAADTDEYRKERALEAFNVALLVCHDLHELKPTGITWVPHILLFIVPRQMVSLGDPTRRSCDACESFGAMVKKLIKHSTCRRRTGSVRTSFSPNPLLPSLSWAASLTLPASTLSTSPYRHSTTSRGHRLVLRRAVGSKRSLSVTFNSRSLAFACASLSATERPTSSTFSAQTECLRPMAKLASLSHPSSRARQ